MFITGEAVGLAEWIIDDTCLVFSIFVDESPCSFILMQSPTQEEIFDDDKEDEPKKEAVISSNSMERWVLSVTNVPEMSWYFR